MSDYLQEKADSTSRLGTRLAQVAANIPRCCGAIMIQECAYQQNINFWQGFGYMFFMRDSDAKDRCNVTAIRQDIVQKYKFEFQIQERYCHMATFKTRRGESKLWNIYIPPNGPQHYNAQTAEYPA